MLVAHSDFAICKCRWLRHTVNQVSVALIVGADACMQGVFFTVKFNLSSRILERVPIHFFQVFIENNLDLIHTQSHSLHNERLIQQFLHLIVPQITQSI